MAEVVVSRSVLLGAVTFTMFADDADWHPTRIVVENALGLKVFFRLAAGTRNLTQVAQPGTQQWNIPTALSRDISYDPLLADRPAYQLEVRAGR